MTSWIAPRRIARHFLRRRPLDKVRFALGGLLTPAGLHGGAWDRCTIPCERHPTYRLLADLHAAELVPERTRLYGELVAAATAGRPVQRRGVELVDEATIRRFFADYVGLFRSMMDNGYVPGQGKDEPGVAVARNGELIKVANGNHRFAVARLLDIDAIPVEIHYVHPRWHARTPAGPDRLHRAVERAVMSG